LNEFWILWKEIWFLIAGASVFFALVFYTINKATIQTTQKKSIPKGFRHALSREEHDKYKKLTDQTESFDVISEDNGIEKEIFKDTKGKKKLSFEDLIKQGINNGQVKIKLSTDIKETKAFGQKWTGTLKLDTQEENKEPPITEDEIDQKEQDHKKDMEKFLDSVKPKENGTDNQSEEKIKEAPPGGWHHPGEEKIKQQKVTSNSNTEE